MSFITWLKAEGLKIEHGVEKLFPVGEKITEEALSFLPVLSAFDPAIGAVATSIAAEVVSIEKQFAAAGSKPGTGKEKLAAVVATISPVARQLLGATKTEAEIEVMVEAIVNALNKPLPQDLAVG